MEIINAIRIKALEFFELLILGRWANPLSKIIDSIQISKPEIIRDQKKIRDVCIVKYEYPRSFNSYFRPNRVFPDRFVFEIERVIISKEKGIIITQDKRIIAECYGSVKRLLFWGDIRKYLYGIPVSLDNDHTYYYLRNTGFYHFILEEMPALLYALEFKDDIIILIGNKMYPDYFYSSLYLILGDNLKYRILKISRNAKTKSLVFTQRDSFSGGTHINDIKILNKYFLSELNTGYSPSKIYISRIFGNKRKIANEDEIELTLKNHGFQIIYMEKYSLKKQIELAQGADLIVSPHGAGLTHIIWNPEKKKSVIEIFLSSIKNDCYASLASILNYNYDYIICKDIENKQTCDIESLKLKVNAFTQ